MVAAADVRVNVTVQFSGAIPGRICTSLAPSRHSLPGRQAVAASGLGGVFCGPFRSQLPCGHSGGTMSPGSPVAEPPGKARGVFVPVLFFTPILGDRGEVAPGGIGCVEDTHRARPFVLCFIF